MTYGMKRDFEFREVVDPNNTFSPLNLEELLELRFMGTDVPFSFPGGIFFLWLQMGFTRR